MDKKCPFCVGGKITIDGSLGYRCPDCGGSGRIEIEDMIEDDRYVDYELED